MKLHLVGVCRSDRYAMCTSQQCDYYFWWSWPTAVSQLPLRTPTEQAIDWPSDETRKIQQNFENKNCDPFGFFTLPLWQVRARVTMGNWRLQHFMCLFDYTRDAGAELIKLECAACCAGRRAMSSVSVCAAMHFLRHQPSTRHHVTNSMSPAFISSGRARIPFNI